MEYSLLAVDLDGTLLNKEQEIDYQSIEAIQKYCASGGKVVICSGRSPLSTRWVAETIGLTDPIIAYNGAVIQTNHGEMKQLSSFDNKAVSTLLEFCLAYGVYAHFYEGDSLLVPEENRWNNQWVEKNILSLTKTGGNPINCKKYREQCSVKLVSDLTSYITETQPKISKIAVFHEEENLLEFSKKLEKHSKDYEISSSLDYFNLEISPYGVTKASSLIKLTNELGIPLSKVAAIGDNYNDLDMLKTAGLGIAMANSPSVVREAANAITGSNSQAGVANAIYHYIL